MPFFASADGFKLHYEIEGSGPPLILHLGAGCSADLWRAAGYTDRLTTTNACILFDHRGHGPSDHPASPEANHIDRYAADVLALVGHLGFASVSYFGWSNGVHVGLKAMHLKPAVFDALVLFGAIPRQATPEQLARSTPQRVAGLRERGWRYLLDDMVAAEKMPVPAWFIDCVLATDIEPYIGFSEARPSWNWSPWDAAPLVDVPALVLAGELEDPDDVMGDLASLMSRGKRVRVPEREHINAFLDVAFAAPLVTDFLAASLGDRKRRNR